MDGQATVGVEDVQVAAKPRRRTYTAEYKRRILELERQLVQMTGRAERAEALIDAQKNLAALLDRPEAIGRS